MTPWFRNFVLFPYFFIQINNFCDELVTVCGRFDECSWNVICPFFSFFIISCSSVLFGGSTFALPGISCSVLMNSGANSNSLGTSFSISRSKCCVKCSFSLVGWHLLEDRADLKVELSDFIRLHSSSTSRFGARELIAFTSWRSLSFRRNQIRFIQAFYELFLCVCFLIHWFSFHNNIVEFVISSPDFVFFIRPCSWRYYFPCGCV